MHEKVVFQQIFGSPGVAKNVASDLGALSGYDQSFDPANK